MCCSILIIAKNGTHTCWRASTLEISMLTTMSATMRVSCGFQFSFFCFNLLFVVIMLTPWRQYPLNNTTLPLTTWIWTRILRTLISSSFALFFHFVLCVVSCPPPLKPRDFILLRSWLDTGPRGEQMLLSRSVIHKDFPPKKGYVRWVCVAISLVKRKFH